MFSVENQIKSRWVFSRDFPKPSTSKIEEILCEVWTYLGLLVWFDEGSDYFHFRFHSTFVIRNTRADFHWKNSVSLHKIPIWLRLWELEVIWLYKAQAVPCVLVPSVIEEKALEYYKSNSNTTRCRMSDETELAEEEAQAEDNEEAEAEDLPEK